MSPLFGHDVISTRLTWTLEISRLVHRHCAGCHRDDGPAFSLMTYESARPWAKAIRDEVLNRRMPPWGAVKGIGEFRNDPSLSMPEIEMFVAWVEGGSPEGDPALLPAKVPLAKSPAVAPHYRTFRIEKSCLLDSPLIVTGLRAEREVEVWAKRPDGTIERLIWLKSIHPKGPGDFLFRSKVRLSRGTTIHTTAPVTLLTERR